MNNKKSIYFIYGNSFSALFVAKILKNKPKSLVADKLLHIHASKYYKALEKTFKKILSNEKILIV